MWHQELLHQPKSFLQHKVHFNDFLPIHLQRADDDSIPGPEPLLIRPGGHMSKGSRPRLPSERIKRSGSSGRYAFPVSNPSARKDRSDAASELSLEPGKQPAASVSLRDRCKFHAVNLRPAQADRLGLRPLPPPDAVGRRRYGAHTDTDDQPGCRTATGTGRATGPGSFSSVSCRSAAGKPPLLAHSCVNTPVLQAQLWTQQVRFRTG